LERPRSNQMIRTTGRHLLLALAAMQVTAPTPAAAQAPAAPALRPPQLVQRTDATYPPAALAERREANVTLEITVDASGRVSDPKVVESGGAEFDDAALTAVNRWVFSPAEESGKPVASRIRVPFSFHLPPASPAGAPPLPPSSPATAQPPVPPGATAAQPVEAPAKKEEEELEATVRGRARPQSRGTSDYDVTVGQLSLVPRKAAAELLKLAPGILLTNEGGEGHASQVFLRGFDAREGQDVEFSVGGVPINQAGNLHGNGYADLNFIIPEVVSSLRVLEGPYDPRQGNFAVAGSADYELGLDERGVGVQVGYGSFGTRRVLALWGPPGASTHTFGAAEVYQTDGFGQNRDATRGSAIGQYEGHLGVDTTYRLTLQGYSARWHSAGVIREDDFESGRKGFFDTYDFGQGGDATRFSVSGEIESRSGSVVYRTQVFAILAGTRFRENFTGFLLDVQEPQQALHAQRGDLIDQSTSATTVGARGFARTPFDAFGRRGEAELGYFARYDVTDGTQYRIEVATNAPYHADLDLHSQLADIGLYGDLSLSPFSWLTLRGGARLDLFTFDILNRCAVQSVAHPSQTNPPLDASCLDQEDFGAHREPVQPATTSSTAFLPRVSALVTPVAHLTLSGSYGAGVRSIDPQFITQDVKTPFASARSVDLGASYTRDLPGASLALRTGVFETKVDRDLIFSESAGRNVLGGSSTRRGLLGAARLTGRFADESLNVTLVRATFDDTGLLIPYVPDLVVRSDTSVWRALPWSPGGVPLVASAGLGVTYVGPRPLPFGERSDRIFTIDASISLARHPFKLALAATNLLDTQYRLGEFNYASDFRSQAAPTLVPVRHFTAGAPRQLMLTLEVRLGGAP
jgi:iron complex outermembrane recepter protein